MPKPAPAKALGANRVFLHEKDDYPKEQSFALLSADPRDIMPSNRAPDYTTWETKGRKVWGWITPGWKVSRAPVQFAVHAAIAKTTRGAV